MKKISRKLLLSILSMAFAVVALGTTTFAWYTSNAKVSASNITAGTSDTGASTLQISTKLAEGYGSAIDFAQSAYQGSANNNNLDNTSIDELLVPVQYGADGNGTPASTGVSYEMYCVIACVLGGINMAGGRGELLGVAFGALSYATVSMIIVSIPGLSVDIQNAFQGLVLIAVIFVQLVGPMIREKLRQHRKGKAVEA